MNTSLSQLLTEILEVHRSTLGDKDAWAKVRSMLNTALNSAKEDEAQAVKLSNAEATKQLAALRAAVAKMHAAKGRHHTQIATCDVYELCGLPFVRPENKAGNTQ